MIKNLRPSEVLTVEKSGHVLLMGLNRPAKRNAFNMDLLRALGNAYYVLDTDDDLRCGVLYGNGDNFTGGLDLADVLPQIVDDNVDWAEDELNPVSTTGPARTTPVVAAVHGWSMTIGIELLLAADVRIAAANAQFAQLEVQRGIFPLGGATYRLPREAGWGNAMRWLLTGDPFDAHEALRLGLVQEVVETGQQLSRAIELAHRISEQAPLGIRATMASARLALTDGEVVAGDAIRDELRRISTSDDAKEGMLSFMERRRAQFTGR
ncbi:crotonase/enoyl-CoA hydratase family protein [Nocardia sp. NPDC005998]|uniref:crotonase/enoyl-CoA hydratase family protein n=1 Tax=Nocardia sp. NPDC005998 TaxID=3156894 RepID=UPI0033BCBDA4